MKGEGQTAVAHWRSRRSDQPVVLYFVLDWASSRSPLHILPWFIYL